MLLSFFSLNNLKFMWPFLIDSIANFMLILMLLPLLTRYPYITQFNTL